MTDTPAEPLHMRTNWQVCCALWVGCANTGIFGYLYIHMELMEESLRFLDVPSNTDNSPNQIPRD